MRTGSEPFENAVCFTQRAYRVIWCGPNLRGECAHRVCTGRVLATCAVLPAHTRTGRSVAASAVSNAFFAQIASAHLNAPHSESIRGGGAARALQQAAGQQPMRFEVVYQLQRARRSFRSTLQVRPCAGAHATTSGRSFA